MKMLKMTMRMGKTWVLELDIIPKKVSIRVCQLMNVRNQEPTTLTSA